MLLLIGALAIITVKVLVDHLRVPRGVEGAQLGRMSEQWIAEHRAMHPS
jgi:hypothetical protein